MSDEAPAPPVAPAANPFAALGGGASFGSGGSGGFQFGVATPAFGAPPKAEGEEDDGEGGEDDAPEEECQAEFKPLVQLEEVETSTGEEEEECLFECKTKLYRFDQDSGEWKERGIGAAKLLQHKANRKVRMLMRQEKTLKIRANHLVMPGTKLEAHAGSDKAWVWSAVDFSEGEQKIEMFCLRFGTVEKCAAFEVKFNEAMDINKALLGEVASVAATSKEDDEAADELAAGLDKTKVDDA
ncbi:hypothetical protein FOA52_012472 [Chlamydomonas sp. UWO 241]|nr:hypothetical protein FOA52_012472 [Chlamydomonas sp. UWO 241]